MLEMQQENSDLLCSWLWDSTVAEEALCLWHMPWAGQSGLSQYKITWELKLV